MLSACFVGEQKSRSDGSCSGSLSRARGGPIVSLSSHPVIIGAGPAGLAAANEAVRMGMRPHVIEGLPIVGGISRTEKHQGFRFDLGGHRFLTRMPEIQRLWEEMLGPELITVQRQSRIHYNQRFFRYPLSALDTLSKLGPVESAWIMASYLKTIVAPPASDDSFEEWVTRRFGKRLYETFFKTYTEKVWGMPCSELRADWAAQRIKGLSLTKAVMNALGLGSQAKTLSNHFQYPRLGPGMMWERFAETVTSQGGMLSLSSSVKQLFHDESHITGLVVAGTDGRHTIPCETVISSMPLDDLVQRLVPLPPAEVVAAASRLVHRSFIIVQLAVDKPDLFPYHWVYVHSPEVRVGRIQNFGNWSQELLPDPEKSSLGMEYFCSLGDDIWSLSDDELISLAGEEIEALGLAHAEWILGGRAVRQVKAYPVYDETYKASVATIRRYLSGFKNLQTIGRSGMHRYNNLDHSMLTGILAARNLNGMQHNIWQVNADHEDKVH